MRFLQTEYGRRKLNQTEFGRAESLDSYNSIPYLFSTGIAAVGGDGGRGGGVVAVDEGDNGSAGGCQDLHPSCRGWGERGECEINPAYMLANCPVTCDSCMPQSKEGKIRFSSILCQFSSLSSSTVLASCFI